MKAKREREWGADAVTKKIYIYIYIDRCRKREKESK